MFGAILFLLSQLRKLVIYFDVPRFANTGTEAFLVMDEATELATSSKK